MKLDTFEFNEEDKIYEERKRFVQDNYPFDEGGYDFKDLINTGLEGMDILEHRDGEGAIEGIISYLVDEDQEGIKYCSIGILLVDESLRGEGVASELFEELVGTLEDIGCEYIVAVADTEGGKEFFLNAGFYETKDPVNDREHLRMDIG